MPKEFFEYCTPDFEIKKKYVIHAVMHVSHIYIKTYQQILDLVRYYQLLYK